MTWASHEEEVAFWRGACKMRDQERHEHVQELIRLQAMEKAFIGIAEITSKGISKASPYAALAEIRKIVASVEL